jgi:DNA-binding PadR family transcriptional regulator
MFSGIELYGYDVNKKLALQGVEVELSRLYRILNDMQKEGLLNDRWEKSRYGPRKKMYSISEKGNEVLYEILLDAIATVHRFYGEYLRGLHPKINVFNILLEMLTEEFEGNEKIAYVTTKYFGIHELIVSLLQKKIPNGTIYVVKPSSLEINSNLENVSSMNGNYEDIPFKNNFIDRLLILDLPKKEKLKESAREWHRVVQKNGGLTILTPTILIEKQEDPMTIGDFVEKHEHQIIEKGEHVDREFLLSTLKDLYETINEKEAIHMTVISAQKPRK